MGPLLLLSVCAISTPLRGHGYTLCCILCEDDSGILSPYNTALSPPTSHTQPIHAPLLSSWQTAEKSLTPWRITKQQGGSCSFACNPTILPLLPVVHSVNYTQHSEPRQLQQMCMNATRGLADWKGRNVLPATPLPMPVGTLGAHQLMVSKHVTTPALWTS